jgi:hypothetical protein
VEVRANGTKEIWWLGKGKLEHLIALESEFIVLRINEA